MRRPYKLMVLTPGTRLGPSEVTAQIGEGGMDIATIHGVEDNALVMELVEGDTIGGLLRLTEALQVARQMAEAQQTDAEQPNVVLNGFEELRRRVPPVAR